MTLMRMALIAVFTACLAGALAVQGRTGGGDPVAHSSMAVLQMQVLAALIGFGTAPGIILPDGVTMGLTGTGTDLWPGYSGYWADSDGHVW